jgi:tRNA pseudouridine13 synthase
VLPFTAAGSGAHTLLRVRKDGWYTAAVATWLARAFNCRVRDVGYCGHKDRRAVTVQHFSVPTASRGAPDPAALTWPVGLELESHAPHNRKLRRGAHRANRFRVRLRGVGATRAAVEERLSKVAALGFANYFGQQRFGRDGGNTGRARAALSSATFSHPRHAAQSIEVSALRSWLFNRVLAARVREGTCLEILPPEALMLDGTGSFFVAVTDEPELAARVRDGDLHPTGPLWGTPKDELPKALIEREKKVLAAHGPDRELLEARGFAMERRALRAMARELAWRWPTPDELEVEFVLGRGSYATVLLGELFVLEEPSASAPCV